MENSTIWRSRTDRLKGSSLLCESKSVENVKVGELFNEHPTVP